MPLWSRYDVSHRARLLHSLSSPLRLGNPETGMVIGNPRNAASTGQRLFSAVFEPYVDLDGGPSCFESFQSIASIPAPPTSAVSGHR